MELNIPGNIWKGNLSACSFIQKHLGQKSGKASSPRVFADILREVLIYANFIVCPNKCQAVVNIIYVVNGIRNRKIRGYIRVDFVFPYVAE